MSHETVLHLCSICVFVYLADDKSSKSELIKAGDITGCHWLHGAADSEAAEWTLTEDTWNICLEWTAVSFYSYASAAIFIIQIKVIPLKSVLLGQLLVL